MIDPSLKQAADDIAAFRAQEEAMQLLLGLILKDQHPES